MDLLPNSAQKTARSCLRKYSLRYRQGYRAVSDSDDLALGTLCHTGMEHLWHGSWDLAVAVGAMRAAGADPFVLAKAEAMVTGYHAQWSDSLDRYEVIAIEAEFQAPLVNPATGLPSRTFALAGKLDGLIRERSTGRVLVLEHKTSSEDISTGSIYWRRLLMDGQISTYFEGARALGHEPDGCLYDVLGKPKQRPLEVNKSRTIPETAEQYRDRLVEAIAAAPGAFYQRNEVPRLARELAEAAADRWQLATLLRDAARTDRYPRNPDACMAYGRCCEFFDCCSTGMDPSEHPGLARSERAHPELTEQSAA